LTLLTFSRGKILFRFFLVINAKASKIVQYEFVKVFFFYEANEYPQSGQKDD
jgi:hypothetical protein